MLSIRLLKEIQFNFVTYNLICSVSKVQSDSTSAVPTFDSFQSGVNFVPQSPSSDNNKTFDSDRLRLDLTDALSQLILDQNISVDTYNATLGKVYNALFPLQTRWVTHRPCCAWYTSDLRAMKREKRQAERKVRKSRLEVHKQLFEESCAIYNSLTGRKRGTYQRRTKVT